MCHGQSARRKAYLQLEGVATKREHSSLCRFPRVRTTPGSTRKKMSGRNLTTDQLQAIKDSFNKIDKNGDGRISATELMRAQQALGMNPSRKEVLCMIKEVDNDNSGFIELKEYIDLMSERMGALDYEQDQLKAAFCHFDKDHSGKLSRVELRQFLTTNYGDPLTEEEFNEVVDDMDRDGDGQIDIGEFCKMLSQQCT